VAFERGGDVFGAAIAEALDQLAVEIVGVFIEHGFDERILGAPRYIFARTRRQQVARDGIVRLLGHPGAIDRRRFLDTVQGVVGDAEHALGLVVQGAGDIGAAVIFRRFVGLVLATVEIAEIVQRRHERRIAGKRLLERRQRLGQPLEAHQHRAEVVAVIGVAGLELGGHRKCRDGFLQALEFGQHVAEIVEPVGLGRREIEGPRQEVQPALAAPALMLEDAEIMQGAIGVGRVRQDIEIGLPRFIEPAVAMELEGVGERRHDVDDAALSE
jgi:hypothetical protein